MAERELLTSESVTEGHPDKLCDLVSDAILDIILTLDAHGRVACETLVSRGLVIVAGEITTECYVDIPQVVRETIKGAGYTDPSYGFDYNSCAVITSIQEQSPDIQRGVDIGGAGDQGIMIGFAVDETPELMPSPIILAHRLVKRLAEVRKSKILRYLRPDGKSQVTMEYVDGKPRSVDTVIISAQHEPDVSEGQLREEIMDKVISCVIPEELRGEQTKYHINPTGRFVVGGPQGDTGCTGRKIMVDTYGGFAHHGGGCFSGKDPTKVDRSASYMARYIAKNIVKAGLASRCEIQLTYAIGVAHPISLNVQTFGTGKLPDQTLAKAVLKHFDLTPQGIINQLALLRPVYKRTACYGHFGRKDPDFTWEKTDKVKELLRYAH